MLVSLRKSEDWRQLKRCKIWIFFYCMLSTSLRSEPNASFTQNRITVKKYCILCRSLSFRDLQKRKIRRRENAFTPIFYRCKCVFCGGKISRKNCELRFPLYFTGTIAMSENGKVEISGRLENVSKPSAPRMKTTCLVSTGRSFEAKTGELAETFDQNWRSQGPEPRKCWNIL